jgi:hypothetical protein
VFTATSNPHSSPHPIHNPIVPELSHSATGYTSYEMAGTGYSSGSCWGDDMPINSLEKTNIKDRSTASPTEFVAGRVYPSDGGWTTADSVSRTVIATDKRYAYT